MSNALSKDEELGLAYLQKFRESDPNEFTFFVVNVLSDNLLLRNTKTMAIELESSVNGEPQKIVMVEGYDACSAITEFLDEYNEA